MDPYSICDRSTTPRGVEQILLETLASVPLADATSFLLPTDPFEALAKHLNSLNLHRIKNDGLPNKAQSTSSEMSFRHSPDSDPRNAVSNHKVILHQEINKSLICT
ncbi:hypothetical protein BKA82DRAFT_4342366 [Pisolithus tinctorius]|nr:hypothetical protein BKA82DRAFT_4342366 [Pisolithus tinctorius]